MDLLTIILQKLAPTLERGDFGRLKIRPFDPSYQLAINMIGANGQVCGVVLLSVTTSAT